MQKITKSTLKSFIRRNKNNLLIKESGSFDGMIDGISWNKNSSFKNVKITDKDLNHTLGIEDVWVIERAGANNFDRYEDENYIGIEVYNCCGKFTLAIEKSLIKD